MQLVQQIGLLCGIGLLAMNGPAVIAFMVHERVNVSAATRWQFAAGCVFIAQYFIIR
jgi:hypothetical protein